MDGGQLPTLRVNQIFQKISNKNTFPINDAMAIAPYA